VAHQPDRTVMSNPRDAILPLIPKLRAYARGLSGGDIHFADDVVQDTIVLALQAWNQFAPGTNLTGWLLRIARNRFYSLVSRKHVTAEIWHDDLASLASVSAEQEQRIELPDFKRAFAALHPSHREVLGLIVLHELTYDEAARVCGCEVGTVKSRMSRARAVLKETFLNQAGPSVGKASTGGASAAPTAMASAGQGEGRVRAVLDKHGSTRHELSSGTFAHCEPRPSRHLVPHLDLERTIT
jgi:RNA polymerase sigma-70 factor (ECF subfamily)